MLQRSSGIHFEELNIYLNVDQKDFAEDNLDAKIQFHSFFHSNRNNWSMFLDLFKGGSRAPIFCRGTIMVRINVIT